jgi:hypothetical protein
MTGMLKGVDLSLLDIIIDKGQAQTELVSLFENADISKDDTSKINNMLEKYQMSTNWSAMFKFANMEIEPNDINIPGENSYRDMNLSQMFFGTNISKDITFTK